MVKKTGKQMFSHLIHLAKVSHLNKSNVDKEVNISLEVLPNGIQRNNEQNLELENLELEDHNSESYEENQELEDHSSESSGEYHELEDHNLESSERNER